MGLWRTIRKQLLDHLTKKIRGKVAKEIVEREGPKVFKRFLKEGRPLTQEEMDLAWKIMEYFTEELLA